MLEIKEIIEWYRDLPVNYNGINELMHARQKLSAWLFTHTERMGLSKKIHNTAKLVYERKKTMLRVSQQGQGLGKAENISRAKTVSEYKDVQEGEAEFLKNYYQYKAILEVLGTMSQHIAMLREELSKST